MENTIALLKNCAQKKDLSQGTRIHAHLVRRGFLLEKSPHVTTTLIHMYAKCGDLSNAHQVHDEVQIRNVVSWNALISGYSRQMRGREARNCFDRMLIEGLLPDSVTLICVLKGCGGIKDIRKGRQIHCEAIFRDFLEKNVMMGAALVDMYANCGMLEKAHKVLEDLFVRDAVTWNALIGGYIQHGRDHEGLHCFREMQSEGFSPDVITYVHVLKACGHIGDIEKGKWIHKEIMDWGLLQKNVVLSNALVDMYVKCGMLEKAKEVLEDIPLSRNVVSWSALIAGYAKHGHGLEALKCFDRMINEGFSPDEVTFVCILKACASTRAIDKGIQVHDEIVNRGVLSKNIVLGTALVDMYVKCGLLVKARQVLEQLVVRDVVLWSVLIAGYSQYEQFNDALNCFDQMRSEAFHPDAITFVFVLKACGNIGAIDKGRLIHDEIMSMGFLEKNVELGTALVDMYAKCGVLVKAYQVLKELPHRDVVSWNALIAGCNQYGKAHDALECFRKMQGDGVSPDAVTFTCILKACKTIEAIDNGEKIYDEIVARGLLDKNVVLGTALVDMFAKCGLLVKAQSLHDSVCAQSVASWNALISGYVQGGQDVKAFNCFEMMQCKGFVPDLVTFICILKACGNTGAIEKGKEIHNEIHNMGLLEKSNVISSALVDMYTKCNNLSKAQQVLEELPFQEIASWNILIEGYVKNGKSYEALNLYRKIQRENIMTPNAITFLSVLCACCHLGCWEEAEMHFREMTSKYGVAPELEHHSCMVVVYGLAGHLNKAMSVIEAMPCRDYPTVWLALLAACRKWGDVNIGRMAFHEVIRLDSSCASAYSLMADLFTANGMLSNTLKVEFMQSDAGNINSNSKNNSCLCSTQRV